MGGMMAPAYLILWVIGIVLACVGTFGLVVIITKIGNAMGLG